MVKLEAENGAVMYINPARTSSVVASAAAGLTIVVADRMNHTVKGTPDEVHAKLFPPTPAFSDTEAARVVLEWAADPRSSWREEIETLARKALGREGT